MIDSFLHSFIPSKTIFWSCPQTHITDSALFVFGEAGRVVNTIIRSLPCGASSSVGQSDIKWVLRSGKQADKDETVDDRDSLCG